LLEGTFKEWENLFKNAGIESPVTQYPSYINLDQFLGSLEANNITAIEKPLKYSLPVPMILLYILGSCHLWKQSSFSPLCKKDYRNPHPTF